MDGGMDVPVTLGEDKPPIKVACQSNPRKKLHKFCRIEFFSGCKALLYLTQLVFDQKISIGARAAACIFFITFFAQVFRTSHTIPDVPLKLLDSSRILPFFGLQELHRVCTQPRGSKG